MKQNLICGEFAAEILSLHRAVVRFRSVRSVRNFKP